MKSKALILVTLMSLMSLVTFSQNEKRFGFEVNAGASLATGKLNDADLTPGFGWECDFQYRFMNHVSVYGGWGWNWFSADKSFAGDNMDFEETGYILGLEFKHPLPNSLVSLYVRGGALYNHIEIENEDGDITFDTGHGWGWQTAVGLDIPLGKNWSLTPGVKFHSLSNEPEYQEQSIDMDLNYVNFNVGILKRF